MHEHEHANHIHCISDCQGAKSSIMVLLVHVKSDSCQAIQTTSFSLKLCTSPKAPREKKQALCVCSNHFQGAVPFRLGLGLRLRLDFPDMSTHGLNLCNLDLLNLSLGEHLLLDDVEIDAGDGGVLAVEDLGDLLERDAAGLDEEDDHEDDFEEEPALSNNFVSSGRSVQYWGRKDKQARTIRGREKSTLTQ